jgi:DNA primase
MTLYLSLLERMEGHQYSNYFSACCPFHTDTIPSLLIFENGFNCLGCGKRGSLSFLDRIIGSHFVPQITQRQLSNVLPRWKKWGDSLEEIAESSHKLLKKFTQFQTYFRKRKIEEFIERGNFGYRDGWAVLPVMDIQRHIVDIVVRNTKSESSSRYFLLGNGLSEHSSLYSPDWNRVQKEDVIYVVFGMLDVWSLEALELPCVTGITGKSINPELLQALGKRMIIIPDEDEERDAHKIANRLGWKVKVKALQYPDGCKDVDDVRVQYGNEILRELIGV